MNKRVVVVLLSGTALVAVAAFAQNQNQGKDKDGIDFAIQGNDTDTGLVFKTQATAKEVGLPVYPGSRLSKEDGNGSAGANLGLWGKTFGFKVAVLKMESDDSQDKIAAFYQKALGKYGRVLDCTNNSGSGDDKDKDSDKLSCQNDHPDSGGRLFKAGSKHKQHLVAIKPAARGFEYDLVYLEVRGENDNKSPL